MPRAALATIPQNGTSPVPMPDRPDLIERIEAWVASYLDSGERDSARPVSLNEWQTHATGLFNPNKTASRIDARAAKAATGWQRISISRKAEITVVRLKDSTLLKESDLQETFDELIDLIDAGSTRLLLDFQMVERLSSGVLPWLAELNRKCSADGRGGLRLCNVQPSLACLFRLSPLTRMLVPTSDEASAVAVPWPTGRGPRPLPEALLAGLLRPKLSVFNPNPDQEPAAMHDSPPLPAPFSYRLVVQCGKAKGRSVKISARGLQIGREMDCEIRSEHPFLSRHHARISLDGDRISLRDLGSTNGTLLNGHRVGLQGVEVHPGDLLVIGPLKFVVVIDPKASQRLPGEAEIADWLGSEMEEPTARPSETTSHDLPASSHPMKREVIEGVLVLTPLDPDLLSGADVSVIREELAELLDAPLPHRVVFNLTLVPRLSNAAIGLLVAHHVRLDRLGGALRLCEPHVRVAEILNQIRVPLLLDVYVTEDEAVLATWEPQRV